MPPTSGIDLADKPTLSGTLVTLRPVRIEDAEGLAAVDAEALRLTGSHQAPDLDGARRWYATRAEHDDRLDLSIIDVASGDWVGEVVLNEFDAANLACSFRILLGRSETFGRGLGTEAARLVLAHAFETVGLNRVSLEVYAFNPRARRAYERLGFVHEGTLRQALLWDGAWVDAEVMSILASEWSRHRGRPD